MKKQIAIIGIVGMLFIIGLSGCTNEDNSQDSTDASNDLARFVGTWRYGSESNLLKYTFFSDGTFSHGSTNGTYEIKDGKLVLHGFATLPYEYLFSDDDKTVTIDLNGAGITVYVLTKE